MGQNKDVIRVLQTEEKGHPDDLAIAYLLGTALIRDGQAADGQLLWIGSCGMGNRQKRI